MRRPIPRVLFLPALLLLGAAGCDSGPRTPPIDRPLDRGTAMEADERMRQSTNDLLEEQQDVASPD